MFVSLRFPDGKEYPETLFSADAVRQYLPGPGENAAVDFLRRSCPDPTVLRYRSEFAEELATHPQTAEIFRELAELENTFPAHSSGQTEEAKLLRTVAAFEGFVKAFDGLCASLSTISPKSAAARRCFLFFRNYADGFGYKELKSKAGEIARSLGFSYGFTLEAGRIGDGDTPVLLRKEPSETEGVQAFTDRVTAQFGGTPLPDGEPPLREYTDRESAVLTALLRRDPKAAARLKEFAELYAAAGTEDLLRLSREAEGYLAVNEFYTAAKEAGVPLCRPEISEPGYYSEIKGLCYASKEGGFRSFDYEASPMNHVTVVCGPDAKAVVQAVGVAHLCASAGGLTCCDEARISPVSRLERDEKGRLHVENLDEHSLCLCRELFDAMLPRQEEAALHAVLTGLSDRPARTVVRICAKSNLTALQKKIDERLLPPCTLIKAGEDRTLEELLKRHDLAGKGENDA